jgi:hypothetical protein
VKRPRRLWPLWLLVCFPFVHADDTSDAVRKPAASSASSAKTSAPGADEELLEFLGSVDEESDEEWIDYLSKADISKAAKPKAKTPAATEASSK